MQSIRIIPIANGFMVSLPSITNIETEASKVGAQILDALQGPTDPVLSNIKNQVEQKDIDNFRNNNIYSFPSLASALSFIGSYYDTGRETGI